MSTTLDPADFNVLSGAFRSIAAEMGDIMLRSAYSSIVREAKDCSTCLMDANGDTVAQAEMIPVHMNSLAAAMDFARRKFDFSTLRPGEAIMTNNPYEQGQHLNDIILLLPVFHEGRVAAFTGSVCHHLEVGGAVAGSNANATEIFHEGIVLPCMRIVLDEDLYGGPIDAILRSNVRLPDIVLGDFYAQLSAVLRGKTLMEEMFRRYGVDLVHTCMREMQDYSERMMRVAIAAFPDGEYYGEDTLDGFKLGDPSITVRVRVRIDGDRATVDLTETDNQVNWPVNSPVASTQSAVFSMFGLLLGPGVPTNAGTYRAIDIKTRHGSLLDPKHPVALRARMTAIYRVLTSVKRALGEAKPELIAACGNDCANMITFSKRYPTGYSMFSESVGGGFGAGPHNDGTDVTAAGLSNTGNTPVESLEMDHPFIRLRRYELVTDSGGPGRQRGGLGVRRGYEVVDDGVLLSTNGDRVGSAPWGLVGGHSAPPSTFTIYRGNERIVIPAASNVPMQKGDYFEIEISGGGGYGDPRERAREAVLHDLRTGKVGRQAAVEVYGLEPGQVAAAE